MKQETIEEVAKKKYSMFKGETYIGNNKKMLRRAAFIKGAEWMKERMFELFEEYNEMLISDDVHEDHKEKSFIEWFEQFKKK